MSRQYNQIEIENLAKVCSQMRKVWDIIHRHHLWALATVSTFNSHIQHLHSTATFNSYTQQLHSAATFNIHSGLHNEWCKLDGQQHANTGKAAEQQR